MKENFNFSNFRENRLSRTVIAFGKMGRNFCLICKVNENALVRVFLHAEFMSAMKTAQNPTVFMKNAGIEKLFFSVIFVNCLRFSLKLLSRMLERVIKYVFFRWKRRQINQN